MWQKMLRNFPACLPLNPKKQSFDYPCIKLPPWTDEQPFDRPLQGSGSSIFQNISKQLQVLVISCGVETIRRSWRRQRSGPLSKPCSQSSKEEQEEGGKRQISEGRDAHLEWFERGECMKKILHIIQQSFHFTLYCAICERGGRKSLFLYLMMLRHSSA